MRKSPVIFSRSITAKHWITFSIAMVVVIVALLFAAGCFGRAMPGTSLMEPQFIAPGLYGGTTSLVGWYDRKGLTNWTTQAADNSKMGAWINNLSYSHTMDLSNSAAQPVFSNNIVGSFPAVYFVSASSQFLQTGTNGPSTLGGTNVTIFMVVSTNTFTPAWTLAHLAPTNSISNNGLELFDGGPGGGPEWDVFRGSPQGTYRGPTYTNGIRGAPQWCIITAPVGMATNDIEAWFNSNTNNMAPQQSNGNPGALAETNRCFALSKRLNGGSFSSLQIMECLIYNRKLSSGERFCVEQYLRRKYGPAKIP